MTENTLLKIMLILSTALFVNLHKRTKITIKCQQFFFLGNRCGLSSHY